MKNRKVKSINKPVKKVTKNLYVGKKIYVDSSYYISHGEDDFTGGLATINKIETGISGGKKVKFIEVEENLGCMYNWDEFLANEQIKLKKEFGKRKAHKSPDINRPWIETGDIVNGKKYNGPDVW